MSAVPVPRRIRLSFLSPKNPPVSLAFYHPQAPHQLFHLHPNPASNLAAQRFENGPKPP
ncbi:hypothetical protein C8R44DRAFT_769825 [Mycena epipterygia]|nr:hypothetical protein C8R44DRAFT_769825 [Mycena epipterygia]